MTTPELVSIDTLLDRTRALIRVTESPVPSDPQGMIEAEDAFANAYNDFKYEHPIIDWLYTYLRARDYADPNYCAAPQTRKPIDAADIRDIYETLVKHCFRLQATSDLARRLRQFEKIMGNVRKFVAAAAGQDGPWSEPDTPKRWAIVFKVKPPTFKRWVKAGKVRAKVLSDRSYQVHLEDLPQSNGGPAK